MTIDSSTRHLGEVRRFVERHAREAGLPAEVITRFKLAVDEACTNVIEHAYHEEEGHRIDLTIRADAKQFSVRIQDCGEAFALEEYQEPDLVELVRDRRKGGLGVRLMHRLMDEVAYRSDDGVNSVELTTYLD